MPCNSFRIPGGGAAIVCSRRKSCSVCGAPSDKLCDYPLTGEKAGKTCDRPLCRRCTAHRPPDVDYCPAHARMVEEAKRGNK